MVRLLLLQKLRRLTSHQLVHRYLTHSKFDSQQPDSHDQATQISRIETVHLKEAKKNDEIRHFLRDLIDSMCA